MSLAKTLCKDLARLYQLCFGNQTTFTGVTYESPLYCVNIEDILQWVQWTQSLYQNKKQQQAIVVWKRFRSKRGLTVRVLVHGIFWKEFIKQLQKVLCACVVCACPSSPALAGRRWRSLRPLRRRRYKEVWWKLVGGRSRPGCRWWPSLCLLRHTGTVDSDATHLLHHCFCLPEARYCGTSLSNFTCTGWLQKKITTDDGEDRIYIWLPQCAMNP